MHRLARAWLVLALAPGASIGLLSCDEPVTELVVVVDTDLLIPSQVDSIEVTVTGSGGPARYGGSVASPSVLPLTLGIVPGAQVPARITIVATASLGGVQIVSREVSTGFVRGEVRMVRILLLRGCAGMACGAGTTCTETGCVSSEVDPTTLPTWSGAAPPVIGRSDAGTGENDAGPGGFDAGPPPSDAAPPPDDGDSPPLVPFGGACAYDLECETSVCVPGSALGMATGMCTNTCCSLGDCPMFSTCHPFRNGLRVCIPDGVALPPPSAPPCASDTSCRLPANTCLVDTVGPLAEGVVTCGISDASRAVFGEVCTADTDCEANVCMQDPAGTSRLCSQPCGTRDDCSTIPVLLTCRPRRIGGTWIPICELSTGGMRSDGDPCTIGSDCIDERCIQNQCAAPCCADIHCARTRRTCRPFDAGDHWEMRCSNPTGPSG